MNDCFRPNGLLVLRLNLIRFNPNNPKVYLSIGIYCEIQYISNIINQIKYTCIAFFATKPCFVRRTRWAQQSHYGFQSKLLRLLGHLWKHFVVENWERVLLLVITIFEIIPLYEQCSLSISGTACPAVDSKDNQFIRNRPAPWSMICSSRRVLSRSSGRARGAIMVLLRQLPEHNMHVVIYSLVCFSNYVFLVGIRSFSYPRLLINILAING